MSDRLPLPESELNDSFWKQFRKKLKLSSRELEIVRAIVRNDRGVAGIARDLGIAEDTVRTYMKRLYSKLGVNSRAGVVTAVLHWYIATREQ